MKSDFPINAQNPEPLYLVPQSVLEKILSTQEKLLNLLEVNGQAPDISSMDYLSEQDAIKVLGKKTTWFWMMRTKGKIAFSKVGKKIFYPKAEIQKLLAENTKNRFC